MRGFIPHLARLVCVLCLLLSSLALAQTTERRTRIDGWRGDLDRIEATLGRDGLRDQDLIALRTDLDPLVTALRTLITATEPQLASVQARLDQLGERPKEGAPQEAPEITTERTELETRRAAIDADLRQARLLDVRAGQLAEKISQQRRDLFTSGILERSRSILDIGLWKEVIDAFPGEINSTVLTLSNAVSFALSKGYVAVFGFLLMFLLCCAASYFAFHYWRSTSRSTPAEADHYHRARQAIGVFLRCAIPGPLVVFLFRWSLEIFGLAPERILEILSGLFAASIVEGLGRGVSRALLAPYRPERRPLSLSDALAIRIHLSLRTSAQIMALGLVFNALHKAIVAPLAMIEASSGLVAAGIAAAILMGLQTTRSDIQLAAEARAPWVRTLAWAAILTIIISLMLGYIGFANFFSGRVVMAVALGALAWLISIWLDGLMSEVFAAETLSGKRIAADIGLTAKTVELAATIGGGMIRVMLVVVTLSLIAGPWGMVAADSLRFSETSILGIRLSGIVPVVSSWMLALLILVLSLIIARATIKWLQTRVLPRTALDPSLQNSISTILSYIGVIISVALAMGQAGIDLQNIAIVAGALSVGIGFGLQSIVSNFVSGLILLAERPIRVGDWVEVSGEQGFVRRISVRATQIETFDRASVLIPNSQLITGTVKNMVFGNTLGRISMKISIDPAADAEKARDILLDVAKNHPQVLSEPAPVVNFLDFSASSLDLQLNIFLNDILLGVSVRTELRFAILRQLREQGVAFAPAPVTATLVKK